MYSTTWMYNIEIRVRLCHAFSTTNMRGLKLCDWYAINLPMPESWYRNRINYKKSILIELRSLVREIPSQIIYLARCLITIPFKSFLKNKMDKNRLEIKYAYNIVIVYINTLFIEVFIIINYLSSSIWKWV